MNDSGTLETFVPLVFKRRGIRRLADTGAVAHDPMIIEAVARAFHWQHLLDAGEFESGAAIARAEGLHPSTVNELLRLTLLAPDIVEQLLAGRQPRARQSQHRIAATGKGARGDHRSLSVASPASARTIETIQKRTTTVDSGQPNCSK